jgi:hypothetical protein
MDTRTPLSEGMDFAAAQLPSTIPEVVMSYCQGEPRENSSQKHFQKFPKCIWMSPYICDSLVEKRKDLTFVYWCKIPLS